MRRQLLSQQMYRHLKTEHKFAISSSGWTATITVEGQPFGHLLFHFVLRRPNWESVHICHSENFESMMAGLRNALRELGGIPLEHLTDSPAAALPVNVRKIDDCDRAPN